METISPFDAHLLDDKEERQEINGRKTKPNRMKKMTGEGPIYVTKMKKKERKEKAYKHKEKATKKLMGSILQFDSYGLYEGMHIPDSRNRHSWNSCVDPQLVKNKKKINKCELEFNKKDKKPVAIKNNSHKDHLTTVEEGTNLSLCCTQNPRISDITVKFDEFNMLDDQIKTKNNKNHRTVDELNILCKQNQAETNKIRGAIIPEQAKLPIHPLHDTMNLFCSATVLPPIQEAIEVTVKEPTKGQLQSIDTSKYRLEKGVSTICKVRENCNFQPKPSMKCTKPSNSLTLTKSVNANDNCQIVIENIQSPIMMLQTSSDNLPNKQSKKQKKSRKKSSRKSLELRKAEEWLINYMQNCKIDQMKYEQVSEQKHEVNESADKNQLECVDINLEEKRSLEEWFELECLNHYVPNEFDFIFDEVLDTEEANDLCDMVVAPAMSQESSFKIVNRKRRYTNESDVRNEPVDIAMSLQEQLEMTEKEIEVQISDSEVAYMSEESESEEDITLKRDYSRLELDGQVVQIQPDYFMLDDEASHRQLNYLDFTEDYVQTKEGNEIDEPEKGKLENVYSENGKRKNEESLNEEIDIENVENVELEFAKVDTGTIQQGLEWELPITPAINIEVALPHEVSTKSENTKDEAAINQWLQEYSKTISKQVQTIWNQSHNTNTNEELSEKEKPVDFEHEISSLDEQSSMPYQPKENQNLTLKDSCTPWQNSFKCMLDNFDEDIPNRMTEFRNPNAIRRRSKLSLSDRKRMLPMPILPKHLTKNSAVGGPRHNEAVQMGVKSVRLFSSYEIDRRLDLRNLVNVLDNAIYNTDINVIEKHYKGIQIAWIWPNACVLIINGTNVDELNEHVMELINQMCRLPNFKANFSEYKIQTGRHLTSSNYPWRVSIDECANNYALNTVPVVGSARYLYFVDKCLPCVAVRLYETGVVHLYSTNNARSEKMLTKLYMLTANHCELPLNPKPQKENKRKVNH